MPAAAEAESSRRSISNTQNKFTQNVALSNSANKYPTAFPPPSLHSAGGVSGDDEPPRPGPDAARPLALVHAEGRDGRPVDGLGWRFNCIKNRLCFKGKLKRISKQIFITAFCQFIHMSLEDGTFKRFFKRIFKRFLMQLHRP